MSTILEALRKVERERPPSPREQLLESLRRPPPHRLSLGVLSSFAALGFVAGIGLAVWRNVQPVEVAAPPGAGRPPAVDVPAPAAPPAVARLEPAPEALPRTGGTAADGAAEVAHAGGPPPPPTAQTGDDAGAAPADRVAARTGVPDAAQAPEKVAAASPGEAEVAAPKDSQAEAAAAALVARAETAPAVAPEMPAAAGRDAALPGAAEASAPASAAAKVAEGAPPSTTESALEPSPFASRAGDARIARAVPPPAPIPARPSSEKALSESAPNALEGKPESEEAPAVEAEPPPAPEAPIDTGRSPPGAPRVVLSFLQWSADPERRFALISIDGAPSQRVREGDSAAGMVVAQITPTGIQFKREGKLFTIRPRH